VAAALDGGDALVWEEGKLPRYRGETLRRGSGEGWLWVGWGEQK